MCGPCGPTPRGEVLPQVTTLAVVHDLTHLTFGLLRDIVSNRLQYWTTGARQRRRVTHEMTVNGVACSVDAEADTSLLHVLRENLDLKGTRFGCGTGLCGACL